MNMYIHMSIVLEELKKIPQYIYKNLPYMSIPTINFDFAMCPTISSLDKFKSC